MATALLSVASLVAALLLPPTLRPPPLQLQRIPTAVPLATAASAAPARCHPPRLALQDSVIQFDFDDEEEEEDDDDAEMIAMEGQLTANPAQNMTVSELQAQLKQLGQRHSGTKAQLIERVQLMQRKRALGLPINDMQVKKQEDMDWYMLQTANGFERSVERCARVLHRAHELSVATCDPVVPASRNLAPPRCHPVVPACRNLAPLHRPPAHPLTHPATLPLDASRTVNMCIKAQRLEDKIERMPRTSLTTLALPLPPLHFPYHPWRCMPRTSLTTLGAVFTY